MSVSGRPVNRYRCYFGGSASKEGGADGKFSSGKTADGSRLFTDPPRFEVYGQIGHLPSMYHAWLCGNLHRGIDGWKIAIEYADKMREVEYPVEVLWPTGWAGERPNPFHSYDEYEDVFLKPILKDVAELRELLRKHRIKVLNKSAADLSEKSQSEFDRVLRGFQGLSDSDQRRFLETIDPELSPS